MYYCSWTKKVDEFFDLKQKEYTSINQVIGSDKEDIRTFVWNIRKYKKLMYFYSRQRNLCCPNMDFVAPGNLVFSGMANHPAQLKRLANQTNNWNFACRKLNYYTNKGADQTAGTYWGVSGYHWGVSGYGVPWLSWLIVRLGIERLLVRDSSAVESLCCTLEQDNLSIA